MRTANFLVLCLLMLLGLARIVVMLPHRVMQQDFAHYYLSSRLWSEGVSPYSVELGTLYARYGFDPEVVIPHATNPPPLVWLFAPLTGLGPRTAFLVWAGLQALSLLVLLWGLRRLLGDRLPMETWLLLGVLSVFSTPVYTHFYFAQVQLLLAALILAAYALHRQGWHHGAVAVITLAGLMKLFPLALVPWFVWYASDRWRGRAWYALEAVLIATGLVVLTGPRQWADFADYGLPTVQAYLVEHPFTYSLSSWVRSVAQIAGWITTLDALEDWMRLGALLGAALIGLAYAMVLRRQEEPELSFALLNTAMVIGTPTVAEHYGVLLIAPLILAAAVMWPRLSGKGRWAWIGVGGLWMTLSTPLLRSHSVWLNMLVLYLPLYALLGLAGWLAVILQRAGDPGVEAHDPSASAHSAALAAR